MQCMKSVLVHLYVHLLNSQRFRSVLNTVNVLLPEMFISMELTAEWCWFIVCCQALLFLCALGGLILRRFHVLLALSTVIVLVGTKAKQYDGTNVSWAVDWPIRWHKMNCTQPPTAYGDPFAKTTAVIMEWAPTVKTQYTLLIQSCIPYVTGIAG